MTQRFVPIAIEGWQSDEAHRRLRTRLIGIEQHMGDGRREEMVIGGIQPELRHLIRPSEFPGSLGETRIAQRDGAEPARRLTDYDDLDGSTPGMVAATSTIAESTAAVSRPSRT